MDQTNNKPPLKSINGRKCITKCYKKGKLFIHPVILQLMLATDKDVCAINPVPSRDPLYDAIYVDYCKLSDDETYELPNELESLLSSFHFSPLDFLENLYNIYSFDDAIKWTLENDYLPFDTIKRVQNCSWRVFGLISGEVSGMVIDYYFDIARHHWIKDYAILVEKDYSFSIKLDDMVNNARHEVESIIYRDFLTYDFFVNCIKNYIDDYTDKWEMVNSHYASIKKYIFNKLVESMEKKSDK